MLDPKYFRTDIDIQKISEQLATRGYQLDVLLIQALEKRRKTLQIETQALQSESKHYARLIGSTKKNGKEVSSNLPLGFRNIKAQREASEHELKDVLNQLDAIYLTIPNLPHASVPVGCGESQNREIRQWGENPSFSFSPSSHIDLGQKNGLMDYESAAKITGSRFVVLYGKLARLQRALIQFMLDVHTKESGYQEVYVPYIVNAESLVGTGQLPKFADDQFALKGEREFYLIPTAEVPLTNLSRARIYSSKELPKKYVSHTPCFRSEAGSYGKDVQGMVRQHQFEKVELVHLVEPSVSYCILEELTRDVEVILQRLKLPYRVMLLCTGDLGFSAAKTYDIEVWLPSQNTYREVSSCSNCESFQSRRLRARWRNPETDKNEFIHTLNGSGLAVGRILVAIMENYQTAEGKIRVPEVLKNYIDEEFI